MDQFETATYKEANSLFNNDFWTKATRILILCFDDEKLKAGRDIKRKQSIMILKLKRDRHLDDSLDTHNARYVFMEVKSNIRYNYGTPFL